MSWCASKCSGHLSGDTEHAIHFGNTAAVQFEFLFNPITDAEISPFSRKKNAPVIKRAESGGEDEAHVGMNKAMNSTADDTTTYMLTNRAS